MSTDAPVFRRAPARPSGPSGRGLLALLLVVVGVAIARPLWSPRLPDGVLVEVDGQVPQPGTYLLTPATVHQALQAAGEDPSGVPDAPVPPGHRVHWVDGIAHILPPSQPLLVGLPIDVNRCETVALEAIPGVGPALARRITEHREAYGPYYAISDLQRVEGIGPQTLTELRPFVTVGDPGDRPPRRPIDLNQATAAQLQRLPGIGPVTASRIVVDRAENGVYPSVESLQRVHGIGPKTVARLQGLAIAEVP